MAIKKDDLPTPSQILRHHSEEIVDVAWGNKRGGDPWLVVRSTRFDTNGQLLDVKVIRLSPEDAIELSQFIERGTGLCTS